MKERICEGVFRVKIPIPYDFKSTNCYIVEGDAGDTIIDTGDYSDAAIAVWQQVLVGRTVERVVITHAHADHFGLAGWLRRQYGAKIVMSTAANDYFLYRKSLFTGERFENRMFDFLEEYGRFEEVEGELFNRKEAYDFLPDELFAVDGHVRIGNEMAQSIWTRGHSIDHTCLYLPEKACLFLGDHLLEDINPIVMPEAAELNPLVYYLPTFQQLKQLAVRYALPGHGRLIGHLHSRIDRLLSHYEKRWTQIMAAASGAEKSAVEITEMLYTKANVEYMNSALLQTITNLNYLAGEQKISKQKIGGLYYFKAAGT